jgi:DNA-binding transcriptional MerR regulator
MATTGSDSGDPAAPSPMLTVAAVARRLGVAPSTLRTWDRRYDLGPSAHTAGSHRRYGPQDLARLVVMRRLTLEGVPPAEAARIALAAPPHAPAAAAGGAPPLLGHEAAAVQHLPPSPDAPGSRAPVPGSTGGAAAAPEAAPRAESDEADVWEDPGDRREGDALPESATRAFPPGNPPPHPGPAEPWRPPAIPAARSRTAELDPALWRKDSTVREDIPSSWPLPSVAAPVARGALRNGGGRVVALPDGSPAARGLARAAMSLDSGEVHRLLGDAIKAMGVREAWRTMAMPVLQSIGERWRVTGDGVDVEHAFAEAAIDVFRGVTGSLRRPRNVRPIVLACAEGDYHTLPLHALAAALAEEQVAVRLLGVGMPASALVAAVRRTGPALVFLYARLAVLDVQVLDLLPRQRPAPRLVVGGPGWGERQLPPLVSAVTTLDEGVERVLESVDL